MAMQAQGIKLRRASTVTVDSSDSTGMTLSANKIECSGVIDFEELGFTTAMRLSISGGDDTGYYPIRAVAATIIDVYGTLTAQTTNLVLTGYSMESIGEVTDFTGPGGAAAVIDLTGLQSTAKEKLMGLRDEGQLTLNVNFNATDAGQVGLRSDRADRRKGLYDMVFTDITPSASVIPSNCWFQGYCLNYNISGAVDQKVAAAITLEIDGPVVMATHMTVTT